MSVTFQTITLGDCPICHEPLDGQISMHNNAGGRHPLHERCLNEWLKQKAQCPVCRADVDAAPGLNGRIRVPAAALPARVEPAYIEMDAETLEAEIERLDRKKAYLTWLKRASPDTESSGNLAVVFSTTLVGACCLFKPTIEKLVGELSQQKMVGLATTFGMAIGLSANKLTQDSMPLGLALSAIWGVASSLSQQQDQSWIWLPCAYLTASIASHVFKKAYQANLLN